MVIHSVFHRLLINIQSALRVSVGWKVCFRQARRFLYSHLLFTGYGTMFNYPIRFRMVEQVMYAVVVGILYFVVGSQMDDTKPDSWFWYGLSILLAGTLIGIIWRFANKVSNTLDEVRKIVWMHEHDIKHMKDDISELKDKGHERKRQ